MQNKDAASEPLSSDFVGTLRDDLELANKKITNLLSAEKEISDGYLELRKILNAYDTPVAPKFSDIHAETKGKLLELKAQAKLNNAQDIDLNAAPTNGVRRDVEIAQLVNGSPFISTTERKSAGDSINFMVGDTHVWKVHGAPSAGAVRFEQSYWQIADLIDNKFTNHRGFSEDLDETLNRVLWDDKNLSLDYVIESAELDGSMKA